MNMDEIKQIISDAFERERRANEASNAEGHSSKGNVAGSKKNVSKSSGKVVRGSGETTK